MKDKTLPENDADSKKSAEDMLSIILRSIALISFLALALFGVLTPIYIVAAIAALDIIVACFTGGDLRYSILVFPFKITDYLVVAIESDSRVLNSLAFLAIAIFALSLGAANASLVVHFLPKMLGHIANLLSITAVPLVQMKTYVISAATFVTFFLIGKKNLSEKAYEDLIKKDNNSIFLQMFKIALLAFIYYVIVGYAIEWAQHLPLLFIPHSAAIAVAILAGITIARFIARRAVKTVDEAAKVYNNSNRNTDVVLRVTSNISIFVLVFSALGIVPFSSAVVITFSAITGLATLLEYQRRGAEAFDDLFSRSTLLVHCAGESMISTSGISKVIPHPDIGKPAYAGCLTASEALVDSCHDEVGGAAKYALPNLKKLGISAGECNNAIPSIDKLQRLGYTDDDISNLNIMGKVDFLKIRTKKNKQVEYEKIITLIKNIRRNLSIWQAANLIYFVNHELGIQDLKDAGYESEEIVNSRMFSKDHLSEYEELKGLLSDNYVADPTIFMLLSGGKNKELSVKDLIIEGFTEEESIKQGSFSADKLSNGDLNCEYYSLQLALAITLSIVSLIFINYSPISLIVASIAILYYLIKLINDEAKFSLKFSRVCNHLLYYTCVVTAFSMAVNAGIECKVIFKSHIYTPLAIAFSGLVIESAVYFDELRTKAGDHAHTNLSDFISDRNTLIANMSFILVSAAICSVAISFNVPALLVAEIAIIVLPLAYKAGYDKMYAMVEKEISPLFTSKKISKEVMLIATIMLLNICFPISVAIGYNIVFMPTLIPKLVLCINLYLLWLFNSRNDNSGSSISFNSISCGCCKPMKSSFKISSRPEALSQRTDTTNNVGLQLHTKNLTKRYLTVKL